MKLHNTGVTDFHFFVESFLFPLTSSWNPFKLWMLDGDVRNVPNGEVVNWTKSSGPLDIAAGTLSPPPQNFNITGSLVV